MSGRRWHPETFVCSFRSHDTPAAWVRELRPEDSGLGVDLPDGRRLARCLRCDGWVAVDPKDHAGDERLGPIEGRKLPRRGRHLREAIIIRLIAIDRAVHAVLFGAIAVGATVLDLRLSLFRAAVERWLSVLDLTASQTGGVAHPFVTRQLRHLLTLRPNSLKVVGVTAALYCVLEGVEAFGLWRERRWAEYLTAVATAGFLPLEILELAKRVTALKVGALLVNLAILVYLVWSKRLFGIGKHRRSKGDEAVDLHALFGPATRGTPFLRRP